MSYALNLKLTAMKPSPGSTQSWQGCELTDPAATIFYVELPNYGDRVRCNSRHEQNAMVQMLESVAFSVSSDLKADLGKQIENKAKALMQDLANLNTGIGKLAGFESIKIQATVADPDPTVFTLTPVVEAPKDA